MVKYRDIPDGPLKTELRHSIRTHDDVLRQLLNNCASHAKQFLTVANGGAAVALMAFMGSSARVRGSCSARISLCLFAAGLIAAGALSIADYYVRRTDFAQWLSDTDKFFANDIDVDTLYGNLNSRNQQLVRYPVFAGWISFGALVAGVVIACSQLLL